MRNFVCVVLFLLQLTCGCFCAPKIGKYRLLKRELDVLTKRFDGETEHLKLEIDKLRLDLDEEKMQNEALKSLLNSTAADLDSVDDENAGHSRAQDAIVDMLGGSAMIGRQFDELKATVWVKVEVMQHALKKEKAKSMKLEDHVHELEKRYKGNHDITQETLVKTQKEMAALREDMQVLSMNTTFNVRHVGELRKDMQVLLENVTFNSEVIGELREDMQLLLENATFNSKDVGELREDMYILKENVTFNSRKMDPLKFWSCSVDDIGNMSHLILSDENGNKLDATAMESGSTVYPKCEAGFQPKHEGITGLRCELRNWNDTYTCLKIRCQAPNVTAFIPSGQQKDKYKPHDEVSGLTCGPGQRLDGDKVLVCQEDGTWRGTVTCGKITKNRYRIRVATSTRSGAGTDGDVYLKLFGEYGESEEIELIDDMDGSRYKFRSGSIDVFSELLTDVGKIKSIHLRLRGWPWGRPYWEPASVAIFDHSRKWYYPFFPDTRLYGGQEPTRIYPNHGGRLCGDKFTNALMMQVPKKQPNTTARDSVGCNLQCVEREDSCSAAIYRHKTKECFWLGLSEFVRTKDASPNSRLNELVFARIHCRT